MLSLRALAMVSLLTVLIGHVDSANADEPWPIGFWQVTADESQQTLGVVMEFRADQGFVLYDSDCEPINASDEVRYSLKGDDITVSNTFTGEKSKNLTFHASDDRSRLTLRLLDSGMSAIVERIPENRCMRTD